MCHSILIVGSSSREALESSYARAFRQSGYSVEFWNPVTALHKVARAGKVGRLFGTVVHIEPWLRKANLDLLRLADELRPSLILVIGTEGVRGGTLAQIRVRVPQCLIYCIYPDSPHNLDSDRIHCLPFFDRVTTSSPAWVTAFEKLGAGKVSYLPFAADTELHSPAPAQPSAAPEQEQIQLSHDVAFIGTWRLERETFLEQLADYDLSIWGSKYWQQRTRPGSPLRTRWGGRSITGEEFSLVCARSKILLNIMDPVTWPGPNMRVFEQPACAAFSLVTRSPAVLELFQEGKNIECFDSIEEAREKIQYYLQHEEPRQRIAQASYQFVREQGHTYVERARQLLNWAIEDGLN